MFGLIAADPIVAVDDAGRPQEIRAGGERLPVSELEAVRDETAAYPMETGPRTVFVVRASGRRFRLVHLQRQRRWTVEQIGTLRSSLSSAA